MAARNKAWTPQKVRERIQTTMLVKRLTDHVLGQVEMSRTQITAALGLLKKALPDLQAVEHSGEVGKREPRELTDAELIERIERARRSAGTAEPPSGTQDPPGVH